MGYRGGPLLPSSLSRSLRELEHVSAPSPVRSDSPLGRIQSALGVDKPLEATTEAGMCRPHHRLGVVLGPGGQAADSAPATRRLIHGPIVGGLQRCA